MSVYAIGDLQGCYNELRRLLEKIGFDPARDKLWLAGDLVNRGPDSLSTLRFIKNLGNRAVSVLGNHDLHLLALSQNSTSLKVKKADPTLTPVLTAKDRDELLDWLRHRPLMHRSRKLGFSLIHAGLPPQWDIETAMSVAKEVEAVLRSAHYGDFLRQMYGNKPRCWSDRLAGMERLRFITNCFTRMRYCDPWGNLALGEKGPPGAQSSPYLPWFQIPGRATRQERIIFGHWSTLGYHCSDNTWALDSGCVWGGSLTALKLRKTKSPKPFRIQCPGALKP
ncbi:MAG: symmetrical bis(5'-nucleosyl)-tetraphosphatase [Gammaproteobacteria bacterium]|nr:symmetrical bis(5'-nucleosyl)-tetraphosphatase [Gammaproteobacteria bacterium]